MKEKPLLPSRGGTRELEEPHSLVGWPSIAWWALSSWRARSQRHEDRSHFGHKASKASGWSCREGDSQVNRETESRVTAFQEAPDTEDIRNTWEASYSLLALATFSHFPFILLLMDFWWILLSSLHLDSLGQVCSSLGYSSRIQKDLKEGNQITLK